MASGIRSAAFRNALCAFSHWGYGIWVCHAGALRSWWIAGYRRSSRASRPLDATRRILGLGRPSRASGSRSPKGRSPVRRCDLASSMVGPALPARAHRSPLGRLVRGPSNGDRWFGGALSHLPWSGPLFQRGPFGCPSVASTDAGCTGYAVTLAGEARKNGRGVVESVEHVALSYIFN